MSQRVFVLLVAFFALATLPHWMTGVYYVNVASQILFYAIFALGLNVLAGYGGLVSLGHAGLFGVTAYATGYMLQLGYGHSISILAALVIGLFAMAIYAALSLRSTGIGFIMITLALGQILWGLAYRWIGLTGGDNGINLAERPMPFGLSLTFAMPLYFFVLAVFVVAVLAMAVFAASPCGASLRGTRDQPRRMTALGYNVWLIRFLAFLFSGFWSGVAGVLFCYYNQFVSPSVLSLGSSAEALLMVISGGTGTLFGPIAGAALVVVMTNVASAYIERWNFVLGAIFVVIVIFMPEGLVPGCMRLWRYGWTALRAPRRAAIGEVGR